MIKPERDGGGVTLMTITDFPESAAKNITLIKYFRNYMTQHLLHVCS
jgi:hypothetical protein